MVDAVNCSADNFGFVRSDWLIGRYLEIEARFLINFNEKKLQELQKNTPKNQKTHSWLDEQLQVASYVCTTDSAAADKELRDLQWGKLMQVNVVKIIRGRKHINIPEGDEQILPGDRLYILGPGKALDNFALMNQQKNLLLESEEDTITLHQFITNRPMAGRTAAVCLCCYSKKRFLVGWLQYS